MSVKNSSSTNLSIKERKRNFHKNFFNIPIFMNIGGFLTILSYLLFIASFSIMNSVKVVFYVQMIVYCIEFIVFSLLSIIYNTLVGIIFSRQMKKISFNLSKIKSLHLDELKNIKFGFLFEFWDVQFKLNKLVERFIEVKTFLPDDLFEDIDEEEIIDKRKNSDLTRVSTDSSIGLYEEIIGVSTPVEEFKRGISSKSLPSNTGEPSNFSNLSKNKSEIIIQVERENHSSPETPYKSSNRIDMISPGSSPGMTKLVPSKSKEINRISSSLKKSISFNTTKNSLNTTPSGSTLKSENSLVSNTSSDGQMGNSYSSSDFRSRLEKIELNMKTSLLTVVYIKILNMKFLLETNPLKSVLRMYSEFLDIITKMAKKNRGTVYDFCLNSVKIYFGGKRNNNRGHAALGCNFAYDLTLHYKKIYEKNFNDYNLRFVMGISTGETLFGVIGSRKKMKQSIFGNLFSLSKLLSKQCLRLQNSVIITESVYDNIVERKMCHFQIKPVDIILFKKEKKTIYALVKKIETSNKEQEWMYELRQKEEVELFKDYITGFNFFRSFDFDRSRNIFTNKYPNDWNSKRIINIMEIIEENDYDIETLIGENTQRILEEEEPGFYSLLQVKGLNKRSNSFNLSLESVKHPLLGFTALSQEVGQISSSGSELQVKKREKKRGSFLSSLRFSTNKSKKNLK